jgi:hypothetical protein
MDAEKQEDDAALILQPNLLWDGDEIHDKPHAQSCDLA